MIQKVDRASIKAQAKQQLTGKVWMTFLCIFVASIIAGAAGQIPTRLSIITGSAGVAFIGWVVYIAVIVFVTLPLSVGLTKVFLNVTYGYKPSVATLFEPFSKNYKNSVLTPLYVSALEFLWYIPFLIVSIILSALVLAGSVLTIAEEFSDLFIYGDFDYYDIDKLMPIFGALALVYLIIILLMIPYAIIVNIYAQTIFVMNEYPDYTPSQCVAASKAMMNGRRWELFVLNLSFIPWYLLVIVTCGIAYIYVGPYISVTLTNYYHRIKGGFVGNDAYINNGGYPGGYPGAPMQQNPQYGAPVQNAQYGAPVQNAYDTAQQAPVQPVSEAQQALDQASHDMMTNFDDYTDKPDTE